MMDARLGPSFVLSVLIVAAAAVTLYRPDPPPADPPSADPYPAAQAVPRPDPPPPTPGVPLTETASPPDTGGDALVATVRTKATPTIRPVSRRAVSPAERPAFARVGAGESLADVARRVYGTEGAVDSLWFANRDRISRPDAPLTPGTVLRTP